MLRVLLVFLCATVLCGSVSAATAAEPQFGSDFWNQWGDGKAELAGYDLQYPRYGKQRSGTAVAVFVTETFSNELRVKADPGRHPKSDEIPVLKLNLMEDYPTGIYDYNLMTSSFVALQSANEVASGLPLKVSFSAQEWCGHVYGQVLFDQESIRQSTHSYFDGEADSSGTLKRPENGLSEDTLFHWARGYAFPKLKAGESRTLPILRSLAYSRLRHKPLQWSTVVLSRSAELSEVSTAAATSFQVDVLTAAIAQGPTWTFYVEADGERRIVKWERDDGYSGELVASSRLPYWQMNSESFESAVKELGLKKRPARTP